MRLAFYQPDIPQNLGASFRLAACFGVAVDIIEPCGFPLTDRSLRRAAMDYRGPTATLRHSGWIDFLRSPERQGGRLVLFTTAASDELQDFTFKPSDILLFGRETAGVPADVHDASDVRLRIPIASHARSLNIVTAAAIALWEAQRQTHGLPRARQFPDT